MDVYDENKNFVGSYPKKYVHENALWHNTVHCWLYDKDGNIYFQLRKDEGKMYTTASGHVLSGEEVKEAFGREVKEEIGIDVLYDKALLVDIYIFKMDKKKMMALCLEIGHLVMYMFALMKVMIWILTLILMT